MSHEPPHEIQISLSDFDRSKLPPEQRDLEGDAFRLAVQEQITQDFSGTGGAAQVVVTEDRIFIRWEESSETRTLTERGIEALQRGDLESGARYLHEALRRDPLNPDALFNLGMVLSDQGRIKEALELLVRLVSMIPNHARAWIAIGVARSRSDDLPGAAEALERAVTIDPSDGYAQRTLGAILGQIGDDLESAIEHLKMASLRLPEDPETWFNLGRIQERLGELKAADGAYLKVLELLPAGRIREMAEQGRSRIAEATFRERGGFRPDAMAYCLGALQTFDGLPKSEVQKISFEIAMLGTGGLDVNDPAQKYTLRSLPGRFSGLHLLCIEYVGFQILDPSVDIQFDLSVEYREAKRMHADSDLI